MAQNVERRMLTKEKAPGVKIVDLIRPYLDDMRKEDKSFLLNDGIGSTQEAKTLLKSLTCT